MEKVTNEEQLAQLQRARNMWEWTYGNALRQLQSIEEQMKRLQAQMSNNDLDSTGDADQH